MTIDQHSKIYVAGHRGLVGSAIVRALEGRGYTTIITRTRQELDLCNSQAVRDFFEREKPEYVFLAAARVGGIVANIEQPGEFIFENLSIQNNIIHAAHLSKVKKLLFLGSSCVYPRNCTQPIREEYFMTGTLEPTNEAYAVAKIAGICLCKSYRTQYQDNFISAMPTNIYGPGDNFDVKSSHVIPALIRKFLTAKEEGQPEVVLWGTGSAQREFLHSDDLADACLFLMEHYDAPDIINVGTGKDVSIKDLSLIVQKIVGYEGAVTWDSSKPDGMPRKLLDVTKIHALGWHARRTLDDGVRDLVEWYKEHRSSR